MYISQNIRDATKFCENGPKKGIFAEEIDETGRRQFLVTQYKIFTEFYLMLKKNSSSFYEVINGDSPSKGYWDLDYFLKEPLTEEEKLKKERELVDKVTNQIIKTLSKLGRKVQSQDFLIMRAESSHKISIHLILNNGIIFNDNKEIEWITHESFFENGIPLKNFETERKGVITGIIDKSVYCQRQNFRILGSTKYGKKNPFILSSLDKNTKNMIEEWEVLKASFIQNLEVKKGNIQGIPKVQRCKQIGASRNSTWENNTRPEIKEFIQENFDIRGGKWRKLNEATILLATEDNNYCEEAERRHKRNNVYLLYNVKLGIMFKKCHKCTDIILKKVKIPTKNELIFKEFARKL